MARHAARKEEKRVYAIMDENRARVERRKAAHEAKMTDPVQMLRIKGRACVPVLDAERDATIDRFVARNSLGYVSQWGSGGGGVAHEDEEEDKVQFEQYRDIADAGFPLGPEDAVIRAIDEQWTAHLVAHSKAGAAASAAGTENPDSPEPYTLAEATKGYHRGTVWRA
ncbi:hypothetical protein HDU93_006032 [Gonapodya sp. JEL0774]|nr:hypothetical protein HDU93_006032 [Gonapodya sp. JEL0774]